MLNTLLLLPSYLTHLNTSTFFPIPPFDDPRGFFGMYLYMIVHRDNQDVFRFSAEVLILTSLLIGFYRSSINKLIRHTGNIVLIGLFVHELYSGIIQLIFGRFGIFYEDVKQLNNAIFLVQDVMTPRWAIIGILGIVTFVFFLWSITKLTTLIVKYSPAFYTKNMYILAGGMWIFCGFMLIEMPAQSIRPTVRTLSGMVKLNMEQSFDQKTLLDSLKDVPADSIYYQYANVPMTETPNIYLFVIESYGKVVNTAPETKIEYQNLMRNSDSTLAENGWHAVSGYSSATVHGGLSWISLSAMLTGIKITGQDMYEHYIQNHKTYPHLINYLKHNGYNSFNLQPPNKVRPGLPLPNYYDFDTAIYADQLNYTGPKYGLWDIPDQYSLSYAHEHYFATAKQPYFVFFETITTHNPWDNRPPIVDDYRTLNVKRTSSLASKDSLSFIENLMLTFKNRHRSGEAFSPEAFFDHLNYDWAILEDYILTKAPNNSIFIILGDHQPPIISQRKDGFETPIHIIANDSLLLSRFIDDGFFPGLLPNESSSADMNHAGLYSLLVTNLATDSLTTKFKRPQGVSLSLVLQNE